MQRKIIVSLLIIVCLTLSLPIGNGKPTVNSQTIKISQSFSAKPTGDVTANLVPLGVSFSVDPIVEDNLVTISAQIENQGLQQVRNVLVRFTVFDDSGLEVFTDDVQIGRIKGLSSASASTQWIPEESGAYTIQAEVDPNNAIPETDETDNTYSETITVEASTPPLPIHDVAIIEVTAAPTLVESGDTVEVSVKVQNLGDFEEASFVVKAFYDSIEIDSQSSGSLISGQSTTLVFYWDITEDTEAGDYLISAQLTPVPDDSNSNNDVLTDGTVTVTTAGAFTHRVYVEIDYMVGHEPTQTVLDYITDYYADRGILVIFDVDDVVPYDSSVSDRDFSRIEAQYNDNDFGYYSEYKWVLFGTTVFRQSNVIGYTYVQIVGGDLLAGNYIFIADGASDSWSDSHGLSRDGAEAAVLMHEFGHSIGIAELDSSNREIYCDNYECVMAMLNTVNAGNYGNWDYCVDHWATRNVSYYEI